MDVMMVGKKAYWMVERMAGKWVWSLAAKLADSREFYWVDRKVEMLVVWMVGRKDGKWAGKMVSW
jgi:hypothetical protein